mmetsp:Transcript_6965/g.12694  ORF Transcript_6965/g.12694 Transcript_6965/m.12694 type:complete len:851 (-) Transcript_6965:612-3164(-)
MESMKARMAKKLKRAANSRWGNLMKKTTKKSELSQEEWAPENPVSLVFHNSQHSLADLLVNGDTLPEVEVDDILQITPVGMECQPIILQVTEASLDAAKTKAITLSMSSLAAAAFGLSYMRQIEVNVKKTTRDAYSLDWILLTIKDQSITRRDQWLLTKNAVGLAVFKTQRLQVNGIKSQVCRMTSKGQPATCGVITSKTKLVFASKSATVTWLIELSREMWEVADDGLLYIEKALEFIKTYFERCLLDNTSHHITVCWYARALYPHMNADEAQIKGFQKLNIGTAYQDVYKTIVELSDIRLWRQAMLVIKRELFFAPAILNWTEDCPKVAQKYFEQFPLSRYAEDLRLSPSSALKFAFSPELTAISQETCKLSLSHRSNSLEAFNLSLDNFSTLTSKASYTGQRILAVTAGRGVYFSDERLHKVTKERIMTSGCCIDLISLRRRPLHATPLLVYNWDSQLETSQEDDLYLAIERQEAGKDYSSPYWMTVHYIFYFTQLEGTANIQGALHDVYCDRLKNSITYSVNTSLKPAPVKSSDAMLEKTFIVADELMQTPSVRSAVRNFCKAHDTRVGSFDNERSPVQIPGFYTPKTMDRGIRQHGSRSTLFNSSKQLVPCDDSPDPFSDMISELGSQHSGKVNSDWYPSNSATSNEPFNPFNLTLYRLKQTTLKRRWDHSYPQYRESKLQSNDLAGAAFYSETFLKDIEQLWLSFIEPTLLPLTTDAWPRSDQLGEGQPYQSFIQTGQDRESIIEELVATRLNKDFQLVTSESEKHGRSRYMSHGLLFHIIIPSESDDYNIEFRTYVRKQPRDPVNAVCLMYDSKKGNFSLKKSSFKLVVFTDWGQKDLQILGH